MKEFVIIFAFIAMTVAPALSAVDILKPKRRN